MGSYAWKNEDLLVVIVGDFIYHGFRISDFAIHISFESIIQELGSLDFSFDY